MEEFYRKPEIVDAVKVSGREDRFSLPIGLPSVEDNLWVVTTDHKHFDFYKNENFQEQFIPYQNPNEDELLDQLINAVGRLAYPLLKFHDPKTAYELAMKAINTGFRLALYPEEIYQPGNKDD